MTCSLLFLLQLVAEHAKNGRLEAGGGSAVQ